jgi:hypothetical protein
MGGTEAPGILVRDDREIVMPFFPMFSPEKTRRRHVPLRGAVSVTAVERTSGLAPVVRHLPLRQTMNLMGRCLMSNCSGVLCPSEGLTGNP